jgi:hypothetical protein
MRLIAKKALRRAVDEGFGLHRRPPGKAKVRHDPHQLDAMGRLPKRCSVCYSLEHNRPRCPQLRAGDLTAMRRFEGKWRPNGHAAPAAWLFASMGRAVRLVFG